MSRFVSVCVLASILLGVALFNERATTVREWSGMAGRQNHFLTGAARGAILQARLVEPTDETAVVEWVRTNAIPVTSVEAGNGFDDLQPLAAMIGDARIVGLGEATHGTREFFQMKHRIFEYLVSELGFTIFIIEASYPDCIAINDYVLHGEGDPVVALNGQGFWTWDTEEVLDLLRWMRAYNEDPDHEEKLSFYGCDMQNFASAATHAIGQLRSVTAEAADDLENRLGMLLEMRNTERYFGLDDEKKQQIKVAADDLVAAIEDARDALIERAGDESSYDLVHRHAVVASQAEWMLRTMSGQMAGVDLVRGQQLAMAAPATATMVHDYLTKVDPEYLQEAQPFLDPIRINLQMMVMNLMQTEDDDEARKWEDFAEELEDHIDEHKTDYITASSEEEYNAVVEAADDIEELIAILLQQISAMRNQVNVRDISMARNVKWVADRHPEARIAVWAHNGHISEEGDSMGGQTLGSELTRMFGDDYLSFGFSFNQGSFQAIHRSPDGQPDGQPMLRAHTVGIAPQGSIARVFASAGIERFILDLRDIPGDGGVRDWFATERLHRQIGALYAAANAQSFLAPVILPDHFDCIIFIETTTRAEPAPLTRRMYGMPEPAGD